MDVEQRAKRSPTPLLAGPYGHPFHPIAVTIPIGAWVSSLVLDIGAQTSSGHAAALAEGSRWLIAIGVVGALIAATLGLLDLWIIPRRTAAFRTGLAHASLNLLVTIGFIVDFAWRQNAGSGSDTAVGPVILTAVCLAVLGISGALGGMLAYRYGVRVVDDMTQARAFVPMTSHPFDDQAGGLS